MDKGKSRRAFLKKTGIGSLGIAVSPATLLNFEKKKASLADDQNKSISNKKAHAYNSSYSGENLNRIAFPIGGIGAGMFCLEGTGAISHVSVRNSPEMYNEPNQFAAIYIKGLKNGVKVLEGPVPDWKKFGSPVFPTWDGNNNYGLPRFRNSEFQSRFPFSAVTLSDNDIPLDVQIEGWSPFIPTDADNSSLPAGALEYRFINRGLKSIDAIFSYNTVNFMLQAGQKGGIDKMNGGLVLSQKANEKEPWRAGHFAIFTDEKKTLADYCWFRGGWSDPLTMIWKNIKDGKIEEREPIAEGAPGASLFVPFELRPGEQKTIKIMMAWYVPESDLRIGDDASPEESAAKAKCDPASGCCHTPSDLGLPGEGSKNSLHYQPWYSARFKDLHDVVQYWERNYASLYEKSKLFSDTFFASTLPAEVMEAVSANLTILKSPTVLRQTDGRLWTFEGSMTTNGCCHGSCTHVWNYAQAIPHLFPVLERSLRYTEFCENQGPDGRQMFRANLPIRPVHFSYVPACDGQLGGIMKVYREWRIYGDNDWIKKMYPLVKRSIDYCIETWDPRHLGVLQEPHQNTYDIDFWGPDGMCASFYLGALNALIKIGEFLKKDVSFYQNLLAKGKKYVENALFNGAYFIQKIEYKNLNAGDPAKYAEDKFYLGKYSPEGLEILKKEGPKYQYGNGCLSDGIMGAWMSVMCMLDNPIDADKTLSHLLSVYKYNFKKDLSEHANTMRASFALGDEGGLLLCTWPDGSELDLPFPYSDEVWTGIEYEIASHLISAGRVEEGLEIVRTCRDRYDGRIRNPFDEYECGHWYARALSSYGLLQGLTGVRYDAVDSTLFIDSQIGDFTGFIATETGFGNVGLRSGKPFLRVTYGKINPRKILVSGKEMKLG